MLNSPSTENDIRARAAVIAEAILSTNPTSEAYIKMRNEFREQLAQVELPTDTMTWFAMERVAAKAGVKAIRWRGEDLHLPAGALLMIDPNTPVPADPSFAIKMFQRASFIIAPATWKQALTGAKISGLVINEEVGVEPVAPRKPKGP